MLLSAVLLYIGLRHVLMGGQQLVTVFRKVRQLSGTVTVRSLCNDGQGTERTVSGGLAGVSTKYTQPTEPSVY